MDSDFQPCCRAQQADTGLNARRPELSGERGAAQSLALDSWGQLHT
jgi:hypothetical protein